MGSGRQRPARRALVLAAAGSWGASTRWGRCSRSTRCARASRPATSPLRRSSAGRSSPPSSPIGSRPSASGGARVGPADAPRLSVSRFMSLHARLMGTAPRLAAALRATRRRPLAHWTRRSFWTRAASLLRPCSRAHSSRSTPRRYVRSVLTQPAGPRLPPPAPAACSSRRPSSTRARSASSGRGSTSAHRSPRAGGGLGRRPDPLRAGHGRRRQYVDATVTKTAHARLAVERGAGPGGGGEPMRPLLRDPKTHPPSPTAGRRGSPARRSASPIHRRLHDGLARHAYTSRDRLRLLEPYERDPAALRNYPLMTYSLRTR